MSQSIGHDRAERFFTWVTAYPKAIVLAGLVLLMSLAAFIPQLTMDTSSDSFIAKDNPARVYRDQAKQVFGLSDPFVIAVVNRGATGVFNPETLQLVQWLTDRVKTIPNVDPERVVSLATENNIVGTADGMQVRKFFQPPPVTQIQADRIRAEIADFPLYQGSLVARDDTATLVTAEILDEMNSEATYQAFMTLVNAAPKVPGVELHVAGEGAISGYLFNYIDHDRISYGARGAVTEFGRARHGRGGLRDHGSWRHPVLRDYQRSPFHLDRYGGRGADPSPYALL
jgi:uncharacterized protein